MASRELSNRLLLAVKEVKYRDELLALLGGGSPTGSTFYVDANTGAAANLGTSPDNPLATLAQALDKVTANKGDVVFLMPGHYEDIGDEQIDVDVAGVSILGLGRGPARPRFDFNHANASIDVSASGCVIENVTLRPSVATVAIGIDIEAGVTDTLLSDLEVLPGEEGDGTDEFVIGIDVKAGCTRTIVRGLKYRLHASVGGAASCVKFTGASDSCEVTDFDLHLSGAAAVACINGDTTLSTRLYIGHGRCTLDGEPGIELLTGTTGIIEDVLIFSNLATIDAATVADGMAHFDVKYVEAGNEAGTLVKTESADD